MLLSCAGWWVEFGLQDFAMKAGEASLLVVDYSAVCHQLCWVTQVLPLLRSARLVVEMSTLWYTSGALLCESLQSMAILVDAREVCVALVVDCPYHLPFRRKHLGCGPWSRCKLLVSRWQVCMSGLAPYTELHFHMGISA